MREYRTKGYLNVYEKLAIFALMFAVLIGSNYLGTLTAKTREIYGNWWGFTSIKSLPQFVSLTVSDDRISLLYDKPRNCLVEARLIGQISQGHEYRLARTSCEHMDKLLPVIRLTLFGDRLRYQLTRRSGNRPAEVGYLRMDLWNSK